MNHSQHESESEKTLSDDLFEKNLRQCASATEAFRIMKVLRREGFVAYLAGGCVRDALLGHRPKDYDVATDATPESVRRVFGKSNTLAFGASFGVIGVLPVREGDRPETTRVLPTEVVTFRSDGDYSDGRRPDSVHYGNAEQDALRRDFTINGLFYDPATQSVIDHVGGQQDLKTGLLRTIGSAASRFGEDKLRMLRAVRFATTLGFRIDPPTQAAIRQHAGDISVVSGERIGAEMRRVMTSPHAFAGLTCLQDTGLAVHVMPELHEILGDRLSNLLSHLPDRHFAMSIACAAIESDDALGFLRQTARDWKLSTEEVRQAKAGIEQHAYVDRRRRPALGIRATGGDRPGFPRDTGRRHQRGPHGPARLDGIG